MYKKNDVWRKTWQERLGDWGNAFGGIWISIWIFFICFVCIFLIPFQALYAYFDERKVKKQGP